MKRSFLAASFVMFFSAALSAAVNLNVQTCFDYTVNYNTNASRNNYNDFKLSWGAIGISGDISKNFRGNFLVDFTGNSPAVVIPGGLAGLWYAHVAWTVFAGSVLTAGLQDSVFGLTVPSDAFGRNVDFGITWTQDFGGVFSYTLQAIQGKLSVMDTWFDANTYFNGFNLSDQQRPVPVGQLMLTLTPLKGLTIGGAGRLSMYNITSTNTNNLEVGAEGFFTIDNDLMPGLKLTLDYVTLMNFLRITNAATNANSFYFAADLSYAIGPVTPGFRYWVRDSNLSADFTNDINQYAAVYAKIDLSGDGRVKLEPYFEYRLTEDGYANAEHPFVARLRFDFHFDIPLVKDEEVIN